MAAILYEAAEDGAYVDVANVEKILGVSKQEAETYRLVTEGETEQLSIMQIVRLAVALPEQYMTTIAGGYLNISEEVIALLKYENRQSTDTFKRDILRYWANKNTGSGQITVGSKKTLISHF